MVILYYKAFLSHRYGTTPLREEIEKNEFETILKNTEEVVYNNINMIQYCYELDENDIGENKYYKLKSLKQIFDGIAVYFYYLTQIILNMNVV